MIIQREKIQNEIKAASVPEPLDDGNEVALAKSTQIVPDRLPA